MKRMKALGVVEWHLTRRQAIYYLLSIGMPTAFLSLLFRDVPGNTRSTCSLYEGLSPFYDGIFYDVYGYLFFSTVLETDRLNNWQKVLRHTPISMVEYYLIKVAGLFVDFLLSIVVVFTVGACGAPCEYVPTRLDFVGLYSHPRKPSVCGSRSGFDLASF